MYKFNKSEIVAHPGEVYGRWQVVSEMYHGANKIKVVLVRCLGCDREIEREVQVKDLLRGKTQSCGCYHKELLAERFTKHAESHTPLYAVWSEMKSRCNNPNNCSAKYYHDKGIRVCSDWDNSYTNFAAWAKSHGYKKGLTIDRIETAGNYEPSNCRFVSRKIQNRNKPNLNYIVGFGRKMLASEWANHQLNVNNLTRATIAYRCLIKGRSIEAALCEPLRGYKPALALAA
jgi:hypothetical protein